MTKATWMTIPALAATLVLGGAAQGGSIQAPDNVAAASDFSSKGGKGHAKGHAKGHHKAWQGHYAWKSRGANNPHFCPPGQAKKPGLGSAHRC